MERAVYRWAPLALAGGDEAEGVLRAKGYGGEVAVFPQFGVDARLFSPEGRVPSPTLRIGYAGGLLPEKGVDLLLRASSRLAGDWSLDLIGEGAERPALAQLAGELGIADRTRFVGRVNSAQMPGFYRNLDVLVLPSRTRPNWKEQFGRVLIEAMACGVVVVGSRSGEIPQVIGEAGLTFAEENVEELAACLLLLQTQPALRGAMAAAGRARVLAHYTMRHIAEQTVAAYERLLSLSAASGRSGA
ncbi:MAG: glycosyltransferase, partial [Caldilineaceae bacterium]